MGVSRLLVRATASCCLALSFSPMVSYAQMSAQFDVRVPMRDGVTLSTDIWLPSAQGKYPAILLRTPYQKAPQFERYRLRYFVEHGYAVILQDVRGRGDSGGRFHFYFSEGKDGYDTIEWIAKQPWSNGHVGTSGASYLGTVQWLAAREQPPHLKCMIPTAPSGRPFDELPYLGGAFIGPRMLEWLNDTSGRASQGPSAKNLDIEAILKHRPLLTMDEFMGRRIPLWKEFLQHPTLDGYWRPLNFQQEDFQRIHIPALTVTGWFDGDQAGAISYWEGMSAHNPDNRNVHLIIGPWNHAQTYLGGKLQMGDIALAPQSILNIQEIRRKFFDWCLKGTPASFGQPRAQVYVTGEDRWYYFDSYPPPQVTMQPLYFHSDGRANSLHGDGTLSWQVPEDEKPDRFTYNPHDPVPVIGRGLDQRPVQRRDDVLVYTTDKLTDSLQVIGRVFVYLYASSSALDTDFTAKIQDVYPDGRALALGSTAAGVKRARYRGGYEQTELLTPGEPALFKIELFDIGHTFKPGHRIRVEVSSSAFPLVSPNQNTGNPVATDTEWKNADQTIYHNRQRPSHILLPVICTNLNCKL